MRKIFINAVVCIVIGAFCAMSFAADWTIGGVKKFESDKRTEPKRPETVSLEKVPDYLSAVYKSSSDFYNAEIMSYGKELDKADTIFVYKSPAMAMPENMKKNEKAPEKKLGFQYRSDSFISTISGDMEGACGSLPALQKAEREDGLTFAQYDASKYAVDYGGYLDLSVVRYKSRIIWYGSGEALAEAKVCGEGKFIIVTNSSVYYVDASDEKNIIEAYTGIGYRPAMPKRGETKKAEEIVFPKTCKILTDNIVRLEYENGTVEHWQIRLTKDDYTKNNEKRTAEMKEAFGNMPAFNPDEMGGGERPAFNPGERKEGGERPAFNPGERKERGEKPAFDREGGERPAFNPGEGRPGGRESFGGFGGFNRIGGGACLLWRNTKAENTMGLQKMWNYKEGGEEPVYEK